MAYNELGYTTLSVAEPLEEALASARLLASQEAWRRTMCRRPSEGESPERSVLAAFIRSSKTILHFRQEVRFLI